MLRVEVYPHHYDLGDEWQRVTGLPMVYAVCAARRDFVERAAGGGRRRRRGAARLARRLRRAARRRRPPPRRSVYDFSQRYLMDYFDKLKFGFTPEYRAGLREFYRRAAAIGELDARPRPATAPCVDGRRAPEAGPT